MGRIVKAPCTPQADCGTRFYGVATARGSWPEPRHVLSPWPLETLPAPLNKRGARGLSSDL